MFKLKSLSLLLLSSSLITSVACGGDDDDNAGGPDAGDVEPGIDAGSEAGCPDHPAVTEMGPVCAISGSDTSPITDDLHLTADKQYLLDGPVFIGDDAAETVLTIDAGVTIFGGDGSFLLIQRGSKMMATGTAADPIVFTSAKAVGMRGPEDWGGLVINGKAPINNADNADGSAPGEAGTGRYGGNTASDSSGVMNYVRVEFAGNKVDSENELNGIAFQGVGSGTDIDFIQTHMTSDDGIEFFGGTVQVKHVVVTGSDDDSIDWTGGWQGKAQFVVAEQSPDSGPEAERGIEADNLEANNSAAPFSNPTLSNFTLISRAGNDANGMRLRRGTKGAFHNFVVTGFGGVCIQVTETQTEANVDDNSLVISNHVHNCTMGSATAGKGEELVAGEATVADPDLVNWQPQAGSDALGIGAGPSDSFFDTVDYAGAFDGTTDWSAGWIETATN